MKNALLAVLIAITVVPARSQTDAEKAAVMEPVNRLFAGMKKGDSAMVHRAFVKTVTFVTVATDKSGKPALYPEPLEDFLKAVGTPHPEVWTEAIWDPEIKIDGNFSQVWTPYAFYLGRKFSHCGVDAFHLIREADGQWRIFHLADTRQREGCQVPAAVSVPFK